VAMLPQDVCHVGRCGLSASSSNRGDQTTSQRRTTTAYGVILTMRNEMLAERQPNSSCDIYELNR
jgi:hypothetical protein